MKNVRRAYSSCFTVICTFIFYKIKFNLQLLFISYCWTDKGATEIRQPRRIRKRDFLKRVLSSSHHRSNTVDVNDSEGNSESPVKSIVSKLPLNEDTLYTTHSVHCNAHKHITVNLRWKHTNISSQSLYCQVVVSYFIWQFPTK